MNTVNLPENHLHDISDMSVDVNIDNVRQEASQSIIKQQNAMKSHFDKNKINAHVYAEGDPVMVQKYVRNVGDSNKLVPRFTGPFKITAVLNHDRYEVSSIDGLRTRKYKNVDPVDKIKPWIRFNTPVNGSDSESEYAAASE